MATEARKRKRRAGDRGRTPYRFTAAQVMTMINAGIIADGEDEVGPMTTPATIRPRSHIRPRRTRAGSFCSKPAGGSS